MNREKQIEESFIRKLTEQLKYVYRDDIHDRASLEANFRQKFETLNKVKLSDSEFDRLLEEVINPDVFVSSKRLRERNTFTREDGTPLQYTLVNIKDWCKNDYEVINQLRMNTDNSYHRYDVILLINGIPVVQIELKTYDVSPRRAMQQIVLKSEYKNVTIPINIILYIESVDNYVKVHLADDSSVFSKIPHPPLLRGGTQPHRPFHALGSDAVEDGQDLARGEEVCGGSDGDAGREWVTKQAEHYVTSLPISSYIVRGKCPPAT